MCSIGSDTTLDVYDLRAVPLGPSAKCDCCWAPIAEGAARWEERAEWDEEEWQDGEGEYESKVHDAVMCCECGPVMLRFSDEHEMSPFAANLLDYLWDCVSEGDDGSAEWEKAARAIEDRIAVSKPRTAEVSP